MFRFFILVIFINFWVYQLTFEYLIELLRINEDNLKNEEDIKNNENLKKEDNLKMKKISKIKKT